MQSAAGGKGRGANGMPTPAQIQAMQVGAVQILPSKSITEPHPASNAAWDVATNAATDA
jgi:hypothetical protein